MANRIEHRILAIDYGEKRLGLAMSDPLGITAQPFDVIENDGKEIEKISDIVNKNEIKKIIVGLPINMSGTCGGAVNKVMSFVNKLKEKVNVEIDTFDERLSTWEANNRMHELGMPRKKKKKNIDKLAATIILETYLAKNRIL